MIEHQAYCGGAPEPHVDYDSDVGGYRPVTRCACRADFRPHGPAWAAYRDAELVSLGRKAQAKPIARAGLPAYVPPRKAPPPGPGRVRRAERPEVTRGQIETLTELANGPVLHASYGANRKQSMNSCLRRGWAEIIDETVYITTAGRRIIGLDAETIAA